MKDLRVRELTATQCAILNAMARGAQLKEIAHDRGVSLNTVKTQAQRAYEKLAVASREDAVRRHHRQKTWNGHICGDPVLSPESDDGG